MFIMEIYHNKKKRKKEIQPSLRFYMQIKNSNR